MLGDLQRCILPESTLIVFISWVSSDQLGRAAARVACPNLHVTENFLVNGLRLVILMLIDRSSCVRLLLHLINVEQELRDSDWWYRRAVGLAAVGFHLVKHRLFIPFHSVAHFSILFWHGSWLKEGLDQLFLWPIWDWITTTHMRQSLGWGGSCLTAHGDWVLRRLFLLFKSWSRVWLSWESCGVVIFTWLLLLQLQLLDATSKWLERFRWTLITWHSWWWCLSVMKLVDLFSGVNFIWQHLVLEGRELRRSCLRERWCARVK